MKIAVAGGTGGTGKTLIATALSIALSGSGDSVVYCDADDVSVVAKIPFNREVAAFTADGQSPLGRVPLFDAQIILLSVPALGSDLKKIHRNLMAMIATKG